MDRSLRELSRGDLPASRPAFGLGAGQAGIAGLLMIMGLSAACEPSGAQEPGGEEMGFALTSRAFAPNATIPTRYTCDGEDVSPPLAWTDPPADTKSFVLISDDPDAPVGTWVHWVLYDLPPDVRQLAENVPKTPILPNGAAQGMTDFRRVGYGGPCPPPGPTHRYFFKLYAVDRRLQLAPKATKAQVEQAIEGHVLAEASLIGTYRR